MVIPTNDDLERFTMSVINPGDKPLLTKEKIHNQLVKQMTNMDEKEIENMANIVGNLIIQLREQKPIKKIKVNRDGKHPVEGYEMTIIPPSDTPPYTRDELIAISIKVLTDMTEDSKIHIATFITDLMLKNQTQK